MQDLSPTGRTTVETADADGDQNGSEDGSMTLTPPLWAGGDLVFAKGIIPDSSSVTHSALKLVS